MSWTLIIKKDEELPDWMKTVLDGGGSIEDFTATREENTRKIKEYLGEREDKMKDEDFSKDLEFFKQKWTSLKPKIDEAYTTLWQAASKNRYKKGWSHKPTKPNPPYSSPAQFFHFLERFFSTKRYGRRAHTSDPNRYGRQRYYPRVESTYPSVEFNRRWKTWVELSSWTRSDVRRKLNSIFEELLWFEFDVVIKGTGEDTETHPPYTFFKHNFKRWRDYQKLLASGKKIPVEYSETRGSAYLDPKRR